MKREHCVKNSIEAKN